MEWFNFPEALKSSTNIMFFFKLLAISGVFCICAHSGIAVAGQHHTLTLKKKTKPLQNKDNRTHGLNAREVKDENPADVLNTTTNTTAAKEIKEMSGSRRYLAGVNGFAPNFGEYSHHPIIQGPFYNHHVHFVPKPYPVVSVQYVPKPFPVPYAVPSHVHVSHLHLRPKCEYEPTC